MLDPRQIHAITNRFTSLIMLLKRCSSYLQSHNKRKQLPSWHHFSTRTDLWWEKDDLGETEKLWAFLLKSAFPDLRREGWETVPDFPSSVPQRYPKEQRSKWKTCERLSEECSAFPSVPQPDARTDVDADPCAKPVEQVQASVEEEMVVQHGSHQLNRSREKHAKEPPSTLEGTALRNNETCKSNHRNETGQQHLHKPSPSSRPTGGRPQSASTDRARAATEAGDQRRREENSTAGPCLLEKAQNGEVKEDLIKRKLPAHGERDFDSCIMTEETALAKCPTEEGCYKAAQCKKDNASNNGSADGNSGGGAIIQSCPMCLVPFPAGFTQMDCDSHLAQCLSEMNEDITW
ncbi:uncharacterized protein LOC136713973 isoform X2 [Amia ocellicauda]|uniref:uncharacterized protein LOC136713973 isoform X2 n=1 Tax=Amia ocellicauda TaxID=2972642 RepID=UPI0034649B90